MSALAKPVAAVAGAIALLLTGLFLLAGPAGAYPAGVSATISISTTTPRAGATITISGAAFKPRERISIEFHSVGYDLGSTYATGAGTFTTVVTIPKNASGMHDIVATGVTSGESAILTLDVQGPGSSRNAGYSAASVSGSGTDSEGLSNTGVAVIGIGAVGVVLFVGGSLLLVAGKRRRIRA